MLTLSAAAAVGSPSLKNLTPLAPPAVAAFVTKSGRLPLLKVSVKVFTSPADPEKYTGTIESVSVLSENSLNSLGSDLA